MKRMHNRYLIALAFLPLILFQDCKSGDQKGDNEILEGKWMIYDATRNGRQTTTLKDGYMIFSEDNILETNILGDVTRSSFQHNGNHLVSSSPFQYDFNVISLTSDSLHLNGKMKAFDMNFYLKRYVDTLEEYDYPLRDDSLELN